VVLSSDTDNSRSSRSRRSPTTCSVTSLHTVSTPTVRPSSSRAGACETLKYASSRYPARSSSSCSAGTQLATPVAMASAISGCSTSQPSARVIRTSPPTASGCLSPISAE
jgi:hypothetical protein